jgi:hypothetical protein
LTVVEVYNGRIKQAMNLLSRTLNSGAMKVKQNQIRERRLLLSENILPMQESGQLIKDPTIWSNQN